jgi:hypothetical protein
VNTLKEPRRWRAIKLFGKYEPQEAVKLLDQVNPPDPQDRLDDI